MRLPVAFVRLPLAVDAGALAREIDALPESAWKPHPEGAEGNTAVPLVAINGDPGDDAVVPLGTKFVLFDYDPNHPPSGLGRFRSPTIGGNLIPDGFTFQFGLNQYEIRYSDPVYGAANGGNDSVITLTVVSREVLDDSFEIQDGIAGESVRALAIAPQDPSVLVAGTSLPV